MVRSRCLSGLGLLTVWLLISSPTAAEAQTFSPPALSGPSRLEWGVSAGALLFLPTGSASLSLPVTRRFSAEAELEFAPWTFDESGGLHFLVHTRARALVHGGRRWRISAIFGVFTPTRYQHRLERRQTRPDGSILVTPESRRLVAEHPWPSMGISGQRPLSARADLRWDAQLLTVVPRVSVGVAWGARRP